MSKTIFLSAGHGGSDPGAVGNGLKEKTINLITLLACKDELNRHGVNVICSRVTDEYDPVNQEVNKANKSGVDLAVSFHVNAGGGDGFEAFCSTKDPKGVKLAKLGEKYIKELGQNSRGVKDGMHLYFIRNTRMTSVLFESFFIDNAKDKTIGDTIDKQQQLGEAYAKAILEYLDIEYIPKGTIKKEEPFKIRVEIKDLYIRKGAGTDKEIVQVIKPGVYTIIETKSGKGSSKGWGRLKSGVGWISLDFCKRV